MPNLPKVIVMIEASTGYGRGLLRGIARYSQLHGPWTFYSEPGGLDSALPPWTQWNADGIIAREMRVNRKIFGLRLPTIIISHFRKRNSHTPYVDSDHAAIGRTASQYFLTRGFRHFAYCGYNDTWWSQERGQYFVQYNAKAGCPTSIYQSSLKGVHRSWEAELNQLSDWVKTLPRPVGMLACNDNRARHIIEVCKIAGVHIPDDIAVLGVDNDELLCEMSQPPISSIPQNTEQAGYEAAELLDRLMQGKKPNRRKIVVGIGEVVTRQSTEVLAITDVEVAKAVRFIRDHARQAIQVGDVVEATSLSRIALIKHFKAVLGRSIHDIIAETRINLFARMLVETNLSISQIAKTLDYPNLNHVARCFRQKKGMTPLAYRKKASMP
jgi:LacI family transcriptional regulator